MNTVEWLGLSLASHCNLSCKYCFISASREGRLLDYGRAENFLSFFSDYAIPRTKIHFTGGEPTLHPKILDMVDVAEENYVDPHVWVATNGVFPHSKLKGFLKRDVLLHVTFEGLPDIHDLERPFPDLKGSSDFVLKTIRDVVAEDPDKLVLRMNYSKNKVGREAEIADFLASLGVKNVSLGVLYPLGKGCTYAHVDTLGCFRRVPLFERLLEARGLDLRLSKTAPTKSPRWPSCGGGTVSFFLTVDGKIVTCQSIPVASEAAKEHEMFIVGEVDGEVKVDGERLERFLEFAGHVPEKCAGCFAKDYCGGCPLQRKVSKGKVTFEETYCKSERALIKARGWV
ncbi:radical SAM protein [Candidatus Bathyarchaeota archaeon]|nr:radical SAM protein [Candidatus Bathyarchaeota archaeon]